MVVPAHLREGAVEFEKTASNAQATRKEKVGKKVMMGKIDLGEVGASIAIQEKQKEANEKKTAAAAARARARQAAAKEEKKRGAAAQLAGPGSPSGDSKGGGEKSNAPKPGGVLALLASDAGGGASRGGADGGGAGGGGGRERSRAKPKPERKGGLYYPTAQDRSVPVWGGDSPPPPGASAAEASPQTDAPQQPTRVRLPADEPSPPKPTMHLPAAIDSKLLGYSEAFMNAPTIPIAKDSKAAVTSSASTGALPSMFTADLEGPAEPEVQPWVWTFQHMLTRGSSDALPPLKLKIADTVLLSATTELTTWLFTAKDGTVRRKNSNKLTPATVREVFEKEALNFAAFNTRSLTTLVHRNGVPPNILDETEMRSLTKDTGDLSGIAALQLYIQSKGGNGTRYVCEYVLDRVAQRVRCSVHKRVYLGQVDGIGASIYGNPAAAGPRPVAYPINCSMRQLNDHLVESTRELARRLEMISKQTILHFNAQFVLDENEVAWFIGGAHVVTQKTPAPPAPKPMAERHVSVNPHLQARAGVGRLQEASCMGDYCSLELKSPETQGARSRTLKRSQSDVVEVIRGLQPVAGGGGSLGDLVYTRDGSMRILSDLAPKEAPKRNLMSGFKAADGNDGGDAASGAPSGADDHALPEGLEAALQETAKARPTHRVPYRAILLDRTLRSLGVDEESPAPPGVLQEFEAKTRRKMDLYYKPAHVCTSCMCWYDRQSRRRAAELDALNSPAMPLIQPLKTTPSLRKLKRAAESNASLVDSSTTALGAMGLGTAPGSLARALIRSSTSLPQLKPPAPMPMPTIRTGARLKSMQLPGSRLLQRRLGETEHAPPG